MNAGPPRIIPAELYLIEHFSSVEYFEPLVQDWRAMVEYLEEMLDRFMHKLPPAYRKRHLSEQPDVVWGGRCIPNFRSTLHQLEVGLEQRRAGDVGGISAASNVVSDVRGQREYSADWLAEIEGGGYAGSQGRWIEPHLVLRISRQRLPRAGYKTYFWSGGQNLKNTRHHSLSSGQLIN